MGDETIYELNLTDLLILIELINKTLERGAIDPGMMEAVGSIYNKVSRIIEDMTLPKDKCS
jgi:hypothetical protein